MRVLGVVRWTNVDKGGHPIAAVHPMFEIQKAEWREINATEEFPTQSQVFWFQSHNAFKDMLVFFRTEPNPGQKDEFRVVDAKPALEILDVRHLGDATQVRSALVEGFFPDQSPEGRKLLWCRPNLLVGPVELSLCANGEVKLTGTNLARIPTFAAGEPRRVWDGTRERLLREDENGPNGYVDWDIDEVVLKRAIEVAVRVGRQSGKEAGQTKRQIEEAARALAEQGVGADSQLDLYRLERTLGMCANAPLLAKIAPMVVDALRFHPKIAEQLGQLENKLRIEVEQNVRTELDQTLIAEQKTLADVRIQHKQLLAQLAADQQNLVDLTDNIARIQQQSETVVREVEESVSSRIRAAIERPGDLLSEVSIFRPFLKQSQQDREAGTSEQRSSHTQIWTRGKGETIKDRTHLQRALINAARQRGVNPAIMLQVHAAFNAGLTPVLLGASSTASFAAYTNAICGSRLAVHCVSPRAIDVNDLIGSTTDGNCDSHSPGVLSATADAASAIDGRSIIVLEGANRSPLESLLVPLLQMQDIGIPIMHSSFVTSRPQTSGLRFAATFVLGQTTVPVTPQLWCYAAAFLTTPISPIPAAEEVGDLPLSSELLSIGDTPVEEVDSLIDIWSDCVELRIAMERFGAALSPFYTDNTRVRNAIVEGLILPFIVTSLPDEDQDDVVRRFSVICDSDFTPLAKQLRRRLR